MYPRKPLPHTEQLARLKKYLRRSRTELRHRYEELFEATKSRRDCPLEVSIRRRAVDSLHDTVKLLEVCVEELRRQEAIFYAPFKPGDRIFVDRQIEGADKTYGPYLIINVLPDKKTCYAYECVAVTKEGAMFKRGGDARVWPLPDSKIRASDAPLNAEGKWEAEYFRRCADTSHLLSFKTGDLTLFEAQKDAFGGIYYRRKDRLEPAPIEKSKSP
jgi:hypothetical protein